VSTPPGRRPAVDPDGQPTARTPIPGGGLAATRPDGTAQPSSQAVTADALEQSRTTAAPVGQGKSAGQGTSEIQLVGVGLSAPSALAAPSGIVLGQRTGQGQAQGEGATVGRGQSQGQTQFRGEAKAQGKLESVGSRRGIGRRDREPEPEPEPEAEVGPPIATKPVPSRRTVAMLGIRAGQVVAWELAVLAVALVHRERLSLLIPVAAAALLLVILTAIRRRGRWLYQWLGLSLRYRLRHRRRPMITGDDATPDRAATTLLDSIVGGAEIVPLELDEIEVALISHAGGLTAVLEVTPADAGHVVEPSQVLPPLPALLPAAEIGEPVVSAQIIIQSIPAPNFLGLGDSAAISYRELAGGVVPATRGCWLALQAQHVAEEYTAADLQDCVIRSVRRLQRRLRKSGLRARLLNEDEIAVEFLSLARVETREPATTVSSRRPKKPIPPAVRESWLTWSAGPQVHTTFRLLAWPDLADPSGRELLDRLVHTPTLATTVTVAARQRANAVDVELEAAVRVTLPDAAAVHSATKEIQEIVQQVGGRIQRMDGEQVFGIAATLPLGGFLS